MISNWAEENQLTFAPHKAQLMTVSRRRDKGDLESMPLLMAGTEIARSDDLKLLGVTFGSDGTVKKHIASKAETAGRLVGMLRRQSRFLSEEAKFRVYVATIRPILEYGCPVFANAPAGLLSILDRIQDRAARLFPGLARRLDPLSLRRNVAGLCQLHRIIDGTAPVALNRFIRPEFLRVQRVTRGNEALNLRSLQIRKSRTSAHQNSFLPYYSRIWNQLDNESTFATSTQQFKRLAASRLRSMQR
jgi:hypothetical protein